MDPGSKQDGAVVNMTRAMEALSPLLKHPRKTIVKVEVLVILTAVLLLLQLVLGCCKRRWHYSLVKYLLQVPSKLMNPLIIYTLGTMQTSPIKNSSYPVWAAFLFMASAGTTVVQQYGFCDSFYKKSMQVMVQYVQDAFYVFLFDLLLDPNNDTMKTGWGLLSQHRKNSKASSHFLSALFSLALLTKFFESLFLVFLGYKQKGSLFIRKKIRCTQVAEKKEETANNRASDSNPQSMKGYEYAVCYRLCGDGLVTIDQIWDCCGNSAYLKDLSLSYALFMQLKQKHYFGLARPKTSLLKCHDFVFKKLLPSEDDFKRAFRIIEVELGFLYDFFFTKYYYTFLGMNVLPVPVIQYLILVKIILILSVGVFAIRKSLVLETPNPIIEVRISEADYLITLLLLGIALIVELVQTASYLASNWAQVSLARMYVKKHWYEPNAFVFGEVIGFLRRVMISGQLRNKINQHSVIFQWKKPDPIEVSDAVKRAVARSFISRYGNNDLTTNEETSLWHNQTFDEYSWALKDLSQLEVMLTWHIATEYCDISGPTPPTYWTTRCRCNKHRGFAAHLSRYCENLFEYVPGLLPSHRRNRITRRDNDQGVAVHLSRYCAYLIGSVPELLPYHEADIAELADKVMKERTELFGFSYKVSKIYSKMKDLEGTGEEDDPGKIFEKGVKLGKQLNRMADGDRWEVLQDFWAETIIHAAKSHYTTEQHMQHLENGGEFLTHIWALLAHAGILNLNMGKDEEGQAPNVGSSPKAAV